MTRNVIQVDMNALDQRMVCEYCAKFDVGNPGKPQNLNNYEVTIHHQPSHQALAESARRGCKRCLFFTTVVGKDWESQFNTRPFVIQYTSNYPSNRALESFQFNGVPISVFTKRDDLVSPHSMLRQREIYPHGNDPGCYKLISDWLMECVSRHPHCRPPRHLALPTRLIDVGDDGNNSIFKLASSDGLSGNYLALSYCWGPADRHPPKLLKANFPMYEAGVPSSFLPRTFQDAFQVARGIGCRYIWIDSLCIIQDSEFDKARELAKMKDVFQNSYLTIAAADSPDTTYGMLFPRPSADSPDVKIEWQDPVTRQKVTAHLRVDNYENDGATLNDSRDAYTDGQLGKRAWTLQERLLPCRVLHYTSYQLVWECQTMRSWEGSKLVESIDDFLPEMGNDIQVIRDINLKPMIRIMKELEVWGAVAIYRYWYRVLAAYSCRELSYDIDKISGISGIADQVGQYVQDTLVNGLWMKDTARGLLWSLRPYPEPRKTTLQVPSWSWASYHGHISDSLELFGRELERNYRFNSLFRIYSEDDAQIDTRTAKEGILKITGLCHPAMLHVIDHTKNKELAGKALLSFEGNPGRMRRVAHLDDPSNFAEEQSQSSYPYLCVQIGIWSPSPPEDYRTGELAHFMGLVLARKTETIYSRVGIFSFAIWQTGHYIYTSGWTKCEVQIA